MKVIMFHHCESEPAAVSLSGKASAKKGTVEWQPIGVTAVAAMDKLVPKVFSDGSKLGGRKVLGDAQGCLDMPTDPWDDDEGCVDAWMVVAGDVCCFLSWCFSWLFLVF